MFLVSPYCLSLPNPLKPCVKLRMKTWLEQRRQAMLQLHLSDQQFDCLLRCGLYYRLYGSHTWNLIKILLVGQVSVLAAMAINSLVPGKCGSIFFTCNLWKHVRIFKVHEYFLWNCSHENVREHLCYVNIGPDNGFMLLGSKPLPEPMFTQIFVIIRSN